MVVRFVGRSSRPAQHGAVGIRWISRGDQNDFRLLKHRRISQRAQQIDRRRQCELRSSQPGNEISAANATTLFQRLQHVVYRGKSTRQIFCRDRFTR